MALWRVNDTDGVAGGGSITTGVQALHAFVGQKLKVNVSQDQAGTLTITQAQVAGGSDLVYTADQDFNQSNYRYPIEVDIWHPYVTITFTNGGSASSVLRANAFVYEA